jgi:carbamoyltransferase
MLYLGVNALNHDASVCLMNNQHILFAGHAERYSRTKNDPDLNIALLEDVFARGMPGTIVWPEIVWWKVLRKLYSGERPVYQDIRKYLREHRLGHGKITTVPHHGAHAALGYYTSGYDNAMVLVIDAIGEMATTSVWQGVGEKLTCKWQSSYPDSMGLFYTAITHAIGLKPNEEEYITMGMAALGEPVHVDEFRIMLFEEWDPPSIRVRYNMHQGIRNLIQNKGYRDVDVAASAQFLYEEYLSRTVHVFRKYTGSANLVISGGCALNCVANNRIVRQGTFANVYVPLNPGDAGLSMGAVLYKLKKHIRLPHAYLGHDIRRKVDVQAVVDRLQSGEVIGIANGPAEYGPRALGNRSLLADPRGVDVKDRVNRIKHREPFRPFAPVVLKEHVHFYFDCSDDNMDFMQHAVPCLQPDKYPAICHVDNTSRVQTVHHNNPSIIRQILEAWQRRTGCAMLLNTSLNIRGEPLVNDWSDAARFARINDVAVF